MAPERGGGAQLFHGILTTGQHWLSELSLGFGASFGMLLLDWGQTQAVKMMATSQNTQMKLHVAGLTTSPLCESGGPLGHSCSRNLDILFQSAQGQFEFLSEHRGLCIYCLLLNSAYPPAWGTFWIENRTHRCMVNTALAVAQPQGCHLCFPWKQGHFWPTLFLPFHSAPPSTSHSI